MRRFARLGLIIVGALAIALVVLVPASARTGLRSRYGGTLVVGLSGGDPDTLDPTVSRTGAAIAIYPEMCLRLYQSVRNHGTIVDAPLLAARLPTLSKDKLTYTIQLRRGIEFNDGTPFDAQAVATSIQRLMTYPGSSRASDFVNVRSVSATGPYTVALHMKQPDSTLVDSHTYIFSPTALAAEGANFAAHPVCAGPFMFDHRVVGDNVTLVKSPYWYQRDSIHLDKIVFKPMPDAAAAVAALEAGDIQVLDQVAPSLVPGVQEDSGLKVLQSPQLGWRGLFINMGNKNGVGNPYTTLSTPLASSAILRQAFEEAIDRNTLNRVVFDGLYQTICSPIPPSNSAWYDAIKVPCTPYDPSDAKKLVAKSGFTNPTVHLLTSNTTEFTQVAQFIQAEEKAVGINVVIDVTDSATAAARQTGGNFETTLSGFEPGSAEPNEQLYQFFDSAGVRDYSGYSNPRVDYVLDNGVKASRLEARAVNYRVAQRILLADRPTIFLYNTTTLAAYSVNVTGVELWPSGQVIVSNAQYK